MVKKIGVVLLLAFLLLTSHTQKLQAHGDKEGAISPKSLQENIGKINILDIRSEEEYATEHIETALVLPLKEISEARLTQLDFQKQDDIVIYANSDISAKKAKVLLEAIGFGSVKILSGGLVHWKEDGFSTVSGKMDVVVEDKNQQASSTLRLEPAEYDFGVITKEGGVVTTQFSLLNNGAEKVTIEEISTSCGCTSAGVSKTVILPEETVSLDVRFDPNFHKEPLGRFSRTVFLQTSEGIELQVKIYVQIQE